MQLHAAWNFRKVARSTAMVKNKLVHVVHNVDTRLHYSTDHLRELHWLPIHSRVTFKKWHSVLQCTVASTANLLSQHVASVYTNPLTLRSSDQGVEISRSNTKTVAQRFSVAPLTIWKTLTSLNRESSSISMFKSHLKLHLFC